MTPIHLTRNALGVARVDLIGGRFDGMSKMAVIGAPICIAVPPPKPKKKERGNGYMTVVFAPISDVVDGENWKRGEAGDGRATKGPRTYVIYAPRIENGKASLALYFVEEVEL